MSSQSDRIKSPGVEQQSSRQPHSLTFWEPKGIGCSDLEEVLPDSSGALGSPPSNRIVEAGQENLNRHSKNGEISCVSDSSDSFCAMPHSEQGAAES